MLQNYLTKDLVNLNVEVENAEDAIRFAGNILVNNGLVEPSYVEEMIDTYKTLGSYIVLAPHIAMPHSKPSSKVNKPCLSFCRLINPVNFNHPLNDPVYFVFALAGNDENKHMALLQSLGEFLMDDKNIKSLYKIKDYDELMQIIRKEDEI